MDVGNLYDCLIGIHEGKADASIFDKYDEVRRQKYNEVIDVVSSENLRLLFEDPDKSEKVTNFANLCTQAACDKELSNKLQLVTTLARLKLLTLRPLAHIPQFSNDLKHDFTQYYHSNSVTAAS